MNANSFDFFDNIYCISLPGSERWHGFLQEAKKVGIEDRVNQIFVTPPPADWTASNFQFRGEFGLWLSFMKAITHALTTQATSALIFEDDVMFVEDWQRLNSAIQELPPNWDLLFLGGKPNAPLKKISPNLARNTGNFKRTHALSFSRAGLLKIHDFCLERVTQHRPNNVLDYITSDFAITHNGYAVAPYVCGVRPAQSDIRSTFMDDEEMIKSSWKKNMVEL